MTTAEAEPEALRRSSGVAARRGNTLTLRLASGRSLDLANGDACEPAQLQANWVGCHSYLFILYSPSRQMFVVENVFYEGAEYLLIDSGKGTVMVAPSLPQLSPKGDRFVVYDWDQGNVAVIEHENGQFTQELNWSLPNLPESGSLDSFKITEWFSEVDFVLELFRLYGEQPEVPSKKYHFKRGMGGWVVTELD